MDRKIFKYLIPMYLIWFIAHIMLFFTFIFSSTIGGYFDPAYFVMLMISHMLVIGLGLAFMIYMIIDCTKRKFAQDSGRVLWIIIIVFLSMIGAIVYYYIHGKNEPDDKGQSPRKKR